MNAKALLAIALLTGCVNHNHYPERRPYVQRELVLPDFTRVSEEDKKAMGLLGPKKELAPKGAPFDLSRYDGSYDDIDRCIIDLTTSSATNKNPDICYEMVSSPELRAKFKFMRDNRRTPIKVRMAD